MGAGRRSPARRSGSCGRRRRARRCCPPGAISAVPGSSESPDVASRTVRSELRSRRAASEPVNPGGMCCTIKVPAPRRAGSLGSRAASARGPPVEVAMTTVRAQSSPPDRDGGRATCAPLVGRADDASAASRTFVTRFSVNASRLSPTAGLGTRSNAPSASASTARAPWDGENAETTTTGRRVPPGLQATQHAEAVETRHRQIERHRVRALPLAQGERLVAVGGGCRPRPRRRASASSRRSGA